MKTWLIKITVNNAGLDFGDDVDFVSLTTDEDVKLSEVYRAICDTDKLLRKEDDEGECAYNYEGWNVDTLMDEVCRYSGWSWVTLSCDMEFEIA